MEYLRLYQNSAAPDEVHPDFERLYKRLAAKTQNDALSSVFEECVTECKKSVNFKAAYMLLPLSIADERLNFEAFSLNSVSLAKNLSGCKKCVLFGATAGVGLDRIIERYSSISPLKALICQNIGAEFIESYCDLLCEYFKKEENCHPRPRFSPGYADLRLDVQTKLFDILALPKHCGITLTDSLIMRPSKSVTAFCGLSEKKCAEVNKCSLCERADCEFREI